MTKKELGTSKIGGQAVLEGIMMRSGSNYSVAVRKPDKKIEIKVEPCKNAGEKNKLFGIPFIRGVFNFVESMVLGIKTLTYSASFFEEEETEEEQLEEQSEEKPDSTEKEKVSLFDRIFKDHAEGVIMGFTVAFSLVFSVGLFMLLPTFISVTMQKYIPGIHKNAIPFIEAATKLVLFILYIFLISKMKDIQRTFMYHGAEHKCINCIETGNILNVQNVKESSRYHKRCGTSFLLIVMVISIIFFMFIHTDNNWLRYGIRLLLLPVIAGVSYEIIRLAGNSNHKLVQIISVPGMMMQKLTTKEPTEDMIEVAIAAVEAVFDWKDYLRENGIEVPEESNSEEPSDETL